MDLAAEFKDVLYPTMLICDHAVAHSLKSESIRYCWLQHVTSGDCLAEPQMIGLRNMNLNYQE